MLGRIWMAAEFIAAFYIMHGVGVLCTIWIFYTQICMIMALLLTTDTEALYLK